MTADFIDDEFLRDGIGANQHSIDMLNGDASGIIPVPDSTGFALRLAPDVSTLPLPDPEIIGLIRRLDPLKVHENELRGDDRTWRMAA